MKAEIGENPVINSAYFPPKKHWVMDRHGRFTGEQSNTRRPSEYLLPYPASKKQIESDDSSLPLVEMREYPLINEIRKEVNLWKTSDNRNVHISYESQQLLDYWRTGNINPKPFFCQLEAIETIIWLNEVAPNYKNGKNILNKLQAENNIYNHGMDRVATKMATGSGKTTVMAMIIAYNCINNERRVGSTKYTKNFVIITPGLTINKRLEELLPNASNNIYSARKLVPPELMSEVVKARVEILNFHVFKNKEKNSRTKLENLLLGKPSNHKTKESDKDMVFRLTKSLFGNRVIVLNDEGHHCYSTKDDAGIKGKRSEENVETRQQLESARLWMRGIQQMQKHKFDHLKIHDLSATPFFLSGSGYESGVLFPWVVSDFGLIDAIECGITKLPRIPIDDDSVTEDKLPIFRNLYSHVKDNLPRKGRRKVNIDHVDQIPHLLSAAIEALFGHYQKTSEVWDRNKKLAVPPVMIIVCNNTATSKLVFEYIAGRKVGSDKWIPGKYELLSNVTVQGELKGQLNTILIDSNQLESGATLTKEYINAVKESLQQYVSGDISQYKAGTILRDILNTVGKPNEPGSSIRCVVSVSMLSEGWDAKNVTHVLGVRAFGSNLLCEQVVGRGLRRFAFDADPKDETSLLTPQYADIIGVPFTFATGTKQAIPDSPVIPTKVFAVKNRQHLEICFPRVISYTYEQCGDSISALFDEDSYYRITPNDIPPETTQSGVGGESIILTLDTVEDRRVQEVEYEIASIVNDMFVHRDAEHNSLLFLDILKITRKWLAEYLVCESGTSSLYLLYKTLGHNAAQIIFNACVRNYGNTPVALPVLDPHNPLGSSTEVDFETTKSIIRDAAPSKSHVNKIVCDSGWEETISVAIENLDMVRKYVRNEGLGFKIPYWYDNIKREYEPDFIAVINHEDLKCAVNLIIEVKGQRSDKDRAKADNAKGKWVTAVNNSKLHGTWDFLEVTDPNQFEAQFLACLEKYRAASTIES